MNPLSMSLASFLAATAIPTAHYSQEPTTVNTQYVMKKR